MKTLIIKEPNENDLTVIDYLNQLQTGFKLNSIDNRIVHRLVLDGTVPVAYGIVKRMAEAILLVNPKSPKLMRAKAMRELMQYAEYASKMADCNQLQCFVEDPSLARMLEKQYEFIKTKDLVLVKNL